MWSKLIFGAIFAATIFQAEADEPSIIREARFSYEDGVYEISAIRLDWWSAKNYCKIQGSELLSIESVSENSAVLNALSELMSESFWISASDLYQEGDFFWDSTGLAVGPFSYWGPDEPSGSRDEHCVEMGAYINHLWNDVNCDQEKLFVCEWHPCPNATSF